MKKNYLNSITAMRLCLWLLFLGLLSNLQVMAQSSSLGGGSSSSVSSPQKVVMPRMTKGNTTNAVSVNGTEYATWAEAVAAINSSSDSEFDIVLLSHVMDAKEMPNKACTIRGITSNENFAFIDDNSYLTRIFMTAPLTFKNITLQVWQIAANGHALTFEDEVNVMSKYNETFGIRNVWGGTTDGSDVAETNVTIKSGQFGWIYGGSTSDQTTNTGNVTGTARVTIGGSSIINGAIFGGGWGGTYGNTEVSMTSGIADYIYGGCDVGDITGKAKLEISNNAFFYHNVFGGSNSGTCGSTEVILNGGVFTENIFAGGYQDQITGLTSIVVDGAKIALEETAPGTYSGGSIYGGGFGEDGQDNNKGKVGSTKVVIKGISSGSQNVAVYGGGLYSKVVGNTDVTIEGGDLQNVYASGYNYNMKTGLVGGNVNLLIKGGTIEVVGAARGVDDSSTIAVVGSMNITIEGGVVKNYIRSGNESFGSEYKACTLTIKNLGSESDPYTLPGIYAVSNLVLDNSIVKCLEPEFVEPFVYNLYGFTVMDEHPINISGNGKLVGANIFVHSLSTGALSPNKPLVVAENLPATTTFASYIKMENNLPVTTPVYKAGQTYRLKKDSETLYTVNITDPEVELGTLDVKWDTYNSKDVMLEDGDQVPNTASITPKVTPNDEGITATLKNGITTITNGTALALSADASFLAELDILPLDLNGKDADITISKTDNIWKYTKAIVTRSLPAPISFNGTIKNTLADSKRVLIDGTAQGTLTFEGVKINSTTTAAPALTIQNGAKVSFSGSLEVKTGKDDQYGIVNNGNLIIKGDATAITSINTTNGSDKGIKVDENASMLSETGTTLKTSGMSNTGTVVVKEGATATTENDQPLQKTYLVTIVNPGNGNTLMIKAGSDIEVKDNDKVAGTTKLTVSGVPASGYALESITVTPTGGVATLLNNNAIYEMPESEVSFAAIFRQDYVANYYTVTIPAVEGVITTPASGSYEVEEGYDFSFDLTLDKGYENSKPVVKANGVAVKADESSKKYIIRNISEITNITIEGIVKDNPTGNAEVEGGVKVQAVNSTLFIHLPKQEVVYIYSLSGTLCKEQVLPGGETRIPLSKGIYLIKIAEKTYKVVI